ncbi:hypothetical protein JNUCC64_05625 [Streptomyces sp. JNUCC 64]
MRPPAGSAPADRSVTSTDPPHSVRYVFPAVPPALRTRVTDAVVMTVRSLSAARASEGPAPAFAHAPDAATRLVLRRNPDGGSGEPLLVGPRTRAAYRSRRHPPSRLTLRLAPGVARELPGVPVERPTNRAVRLAELPAGLPPFDDTDPELLEQVLELVPPAPRSRSRAAAEDRARLPRSAMTALTDPGTGPTGAWEPPPTTAPAHRSPETGRVAVRELARRLSVSERRLRLLFTDGVGPPPAYAARVERVRRPLVARTAVDPATATAQGQPVPFSVRPAPAAAPDADGLPWARLAVTTGHYDQSHMTADFRALRGVPPGAHFGGRHPGAGPCRSADRL